MRRATYLLATILAGLSLGLAVPQARADTRLPHLKKIPNPHCYTLRTSHGTRHDKHLLWHLTRRGPARGQYTRMFTTISEESGWGHAARNASGASGYAQFMPEWWAHRWLWDPMDGALNIRMFVYCIEHPRETGGWSNWAGH